MNLLSAREVNAKVLITAHVPPGYFERAFYGPMLKTNWTTQNINNDYADLMTNFTDVVSCKMSMILIVEKRKIYFHQMRYFVKSTLSSVVSLVNSLLSRNFCQKMVRVNFHKFHTVFLSTL